MNCHFLVAEPLRPFQPLYSMPLEGLPASLGPSLRTASGAKRSLGGMLPSSAVCAMTGESAAKDDCIRECTQGRQLINLGRNSERDEHDDHFAV
jgi:hypothetical protein